MFRATIPAFSDTAVGDFAVAQEGKRKVEKVGGDAGSAAFIVGIWQMMAALKKKQVLSTAVQTRAANGTSQTKCHDEPSPLVVALSDQGWPI